MKYNKKKHPIVFLVAALMACQPITAQAVTFADMNQVPWAGAEVSINKAANLGLVVGETRNGKSYFRPKDSVSLCESAQLAYKVLLNTGKIKADSSITEKWTTVLNTYKIPSWAHTAISMCLDEGIVSIADLSTFMSGSSTKAATREQAAEILGRALTVGDPSYTASATTTKFVDNANIASDARPYVAVLNQAGIVNGDDTNRFNPKSTLNRTETAVMVTNLYEKLSGSSSVVKPSTPTTPSVPSTTTSTKTGSVAALTNFYVNFENSNAYYLYTSSSIPATLNGESTTISKLASMFLNGTDMEATITLNSSSRVTKLAVATDDYAIDGDEVKGEITSLSNTRIKIDNKAYEIKSKNKVIVKIDGDTADFNDLMDLYNEEDEVEATVTLDDDKSVIKIVVNDGGSSSNSSSSSKSDTVKGDIKSLSKTKIKIGSNSYNIKNSSKVTVKINGTTKSFDKLLNIYEDDFDIKATITLDKDKYVTKIVAEYDEDDFDYDEKGEVTHLSDDEIEINDDDTYEIDDWTEIKIDGKSYDLDEMMEEYEDLKSDEYFEAKLVLDKDDDDYVEKLYLTTKVDDDDDDDEKEVEGKIKDIDDDSIKIGNKTYDLDSRVDIDIENGDADIDDLDDLIDAFEEGFVFEVTALVEDDEVTEIEGYIVEVTGYLSDYDNDEVEIETDWDTVTYEFDDSDDYDDFEEEVEEALDDDYDLDEIEVTLEFEDGKIVKYSLDY